MEPNNNQIPQNQSPKVGMHPHIKDWVYIGLFFVVALASVAYVFMKKDQVKVVAPVSSAQNAVKTTLSDSPALNTFPIDLIPFDSRGNAPTAQYWDNPTAKGALFTVKGTFADVSASYDQRLNKTGWVISDKKVDPAQTSFIISNKRINVGASVTITPAPDGKAVVISVRIQK